MSILNNPIKKTIEVTSGSGSDSFTTHGLCHQIIVQPTTSTTTYDFSLVDNNSLDVFNTTDEVGNINELVVIPLSGTYTVQIANASKDEDFTVLISIRNS